jgi:hypothetical protein
MANDSPALPVRPESQQDRCSDQRHLWRRSALFGFEHMRCQCGAVHPSDLARLLVAAAEANR